MSKLNLKLQEPVCRDALAAGRLVELLPGHAVPGFDLHALYPAARPVPPKTRAVLAILEAHLRRSLAATHACSAPEVDA